MAHVAGYLLIFLSVFLAGVGAGALAEHYTKIFRRFW